MKDLDFFVFKFMIAKVSIFFKAYSANSNCLLVLFQTESISRVTFTLLL